MYSPEVHICKTQHIYTIHISYIIYPTPHAASSSGHRPAGCTFTRPGSSSNMACSEKPPRKLRKIRGENSGNAGNLSVIRWL